MTSPSPTESSSNMKAAQDVHLLVLIHGMWGNPKHLAELSRIIRETHPPVPEASIRLQVLIPESNRDESTYDGIDWGGERIAQEVLDHIDTLRTSGSPVTKISMAGYSLGGLLARYVAGILYQRDLFSTVQPVSFATFATPHLGLPRYKTLFNKLAWTFGPTLLSRTGGQFYCVDKWSPRGRPLLLVLADPEQIFYKALARFPRVTIFANAVNDLTVPYVTAAIETHDPFVNHKDTGVQVTYVDDYLPVIKSYHIPDTPPTKEKVSVSKRIRRIITSPNPGPPFIQFRFPGNLVMYALLPILIPVFLSLAILRLGLAARRSQSRIMLLESEPATAGSRLIHAVAEMERAVESAVVDMAENQPGSPETRPTSPAQGLDSFVADTQHGHPMATQKGAPVLNATQLEIAAKLNTLPQLEKKLVYIEPARNSHAIIVARDPTNFAWHVEGWGVIRCWADAFEV